MSGIKSTVEMIYDARSNKSGMIEIEVQGWTYEPMGQRYVTRVMDYVIITQDMPVYTPEGGYATQSIAMRNVIAQKEIVYSKEEVDGIFSLIGNSIDITESFTTELDSIISASLLIVTQQDPIYRVASTGDLSSAAEWVLNVPAPPEVGGTESGGTQSGGEEEPILE